MEHDFDAEGVCALCGFDGAEWWHWRHQTYEGRAQPEAKQPPCKRPEEYGPTPMQPWNYGLM